MKETLVIGSTVVDVLLTLPRIPLRGEDVNIASSGYRIGGCAWNVYKTLRLFKSPARLCSPVGTGIYGRMVREALAAEGLSPFASLETENGCCYCLIEPDGERTFLSHHGAEYVFSRNWMKDIDYSRVDSVFICGIEVEDPTGGEIACFAMNLREVSSSGESTPEGTSTPAENLASAVSGRFIPELYFAPGPRIMHIAQDRMDTLFACRPILHLNETEALAYSGWLDNMAIPGVEAAAEILAAKTNNTVVITLGKRGCYYREGPAAGAPDCGFVQGFPAAVKDTTGAGDAHCGALIAARKQGKSLREACIIANQIGAAVTGQNGAVLDKLPV